MLKKITIFPIFILLLLNTNSFSENNKEVNLKEMFFLDSNGNFPLYWQDNSIYTTLFQNNNNDNKDISILYESLVVFYSYKTGIKVENSTTHRYNINEIKNRIRRSKMILIVANDLFSENIPNLMKIEKYLEEFKIKDKLVGRVKSIYIPNNCGLVFSVNKNNNISSSVLYIEDFIDFTNKIKCVEIFSPSMVFVKPVLEKNIKIDDVASYIPELLSGSVGYCRKFGKENLSCISDYLERVSRKIGSWVR